MHPGRPRLRLSFVTTISRRRVAGTTAVLLLGALGHLPGQCPDGTPPPCGRHTAPPARTVAVMYFENLSRDSADALLADGFSEELMVQLGKVEPLHVAPRGQVLRVRRQTPDPTAIGRALSVAYRSSTRYAAIHGSCACSSRCGRGEMHYVLGRLLRAWSAEISLPLCST